MDGLDTVLSHFDTIYLGYSGGLDSCVLLHQLCRYESLRKKLVAVHIHHGLSPNADEWVKWTQKNVEALSISYQVHYVHITDKNNLEASARKERYAIFNQLLKSKKDVLLLAHHQNDQAETLLLHLFRGTGIDGLSAMPEWRTLGKGQVYRPLLKENRLTLERYAKENQLEWLEDESNENQYFSRNFLRKNIIPQLETRWPGLINNLCRTAEHCQNAKAQIDDAADKCLSEVMDKERINIHLIQKYTKSMQMTLLRLWLEKKQIKKPQYKQLACILDEIVAASKDAMPLMSWKGGMIRRYQNYLYAFSSSERVSIEKKLSESQELASLNIQFRFRQGGEKIRLNGKTQCVKKLFQSWKIPPWERNEIPLIYIDEQLACIQGYVVSDDFLFLPDSIHQCKEKGFSE